jgi:hypothetical protein
VGAQVADALRERDANGSRDVLARRVRELLDAYRQGDHLDRRAAAFELSVASAQLVVSMDLERGAVR